MPNDPSQRAAVQNTSSCCAKKGDGKRVCFSVIVYIVLIYYGIMNITMLEYMESHNTNTISTDISIQAIDQSVYHEGD